MASWTHIRLPRNGFPVAVLLGLWMVLAPTWAVAGGAPQSAEALLAWSQLPALPVPEGVAGPLAGVSGGGLLLAGGANFPGAKPWEGGKKVWHDVVFVLAKPDGAWQPAGRLPRALAYGVSAGYRDAVVCAGGSDAARHYADAFRLRWQGGRLQIEPLPPLPRPVANACGAVVGDTLYVAGGTESPDAARALRTFFALNLADAGARWQELAPWPGPPRMLATAAVQEGRFFVVGGADLYAGPGGKPSRKYLSDAYSFQPGKGWKRIADLPHPVVAAPSPAPALGQSHFLILGGDDGSRAGAPPAANHPGFSNSVLAYHTITDTWTPLGRTPAPRVTAPVVAWRGRWVIPSGEVRPGVRSPQVWCFTPESRKAGFGWVNYVTLVAYLLGVVALGAAFTWRNKTTNDFFRGGQRVPWWAAGLSIFATMLSSITFMAIPARAYGTNWELYLANSYLLITPLITLVFLPFYRSLDVTSAYEYLERRFNVATRLVASGLFIVFQGGRVAIVLLLPALALATVSNFDVTTCIILMGVLCVLYTVLGGMEAVVWTDVAQAIVLMGGALWALVTLVGQIDGGLPQLFAAAHADGKFFEQVDWGLDWTAAGWAIVVGSLFHNLFPYAASQDVVQRYVATRDRRSAARAIWLNALVSVPAQAVFFAIGTALFVFYKQHPDRLAPTLPTDAIFPLFIVRELPLGVAGLIVAGIFAAAQSTLSSSLNSMATAYVTDFHRRFRPAADDAACLRLARWLTALVGVAGTAAAIVLARSDIRSLWEAFLSVLGLFGGTVSGLFLLGIFSRRANGAGAIAGALASGATVWYVAQHQLVHFYCYGLVGVVTCVTVGWLASWLLPGRSTAPQGMTVYTFARRNC